MSAKRYEVIALSTALYNPPELWGILRQIIYGPRESDEPPPPARRTMFPNIRKRIMGAALSHCDLGLTMTVSIAALDLIDAQHPTTNAELVATLKGDTDAERRLMALEKEAGE